MFFAASKPPVPGAPVEPVVQHVVNGAVLGKCEVQLGELPRERRTRSGRTPPQLYFTHCYHLQVRALRCVCCRWRSGSSCRVHAVSWHVSCGGTMRASMPAASSHHTLAVRGVCACACACGQSDLYVPVRHATAAEQLVVESRQRERYSAVPWSRHRLRTAMTVTPRPSPTARDGRSRARGEVPALGSGRGALSAIRVEPPALVGNAATPVSMHSELKSPTAVRTPVAQRASKAQSPGVKRGRGRKAGQRSLRGSTTGDDCQAESPKLLPAPIDASALPTSTLAAELTALSAASGDGGAGAASEVDPVVLQRLAEVQRRTGTCADEIRACIRRVAEANGPGTSVWEAAKLWVRQEMEALGITDEYASAPSPPLS